MEETIRSVSAGKSYRCRMDCGRYYDRYYNFEEECAVYEDENQVPLQLLEAAKKRLSYDVPGEELF